MCLSDKYILRLTNTVVGNQAPRLTTKKDGVFIIVPNYLVGKGKCQIKVNDINVQLRNGTGNRVVANGTHLVCIRSNIPKLGYNNENNGHPNILGTAVVETDNVNAVKIDSSASYEFTCPQLPQEIFLERMCYKITTPFNLIAANTFFTDVVPFQVDLEIEFFEDQKDNK
tara:strand:+ start:1206 stop:1715 length:510 start_codon:yes stop_codon:yes gene_type:complete